MVAFQQQANAKVSEKHDAEAGDREPGVDASLPATNELGVAHSRIKNPDQHRPDTFDVPAEPVPPGNMRPDAACNHAEGKKAETKKDSFFVDAPQGLKIR